MSAAANVQSISGELVVHIAGQNTIGGCTESSIRALRTVEKVRKLKSEGWANQTAESTAVVEIYRAKDHSVGSGCRFLLIMETYDSSEHICSLRLFLTLGELVCR